MHTKTYQTPACLGSVALPGASRKSGACAVAGASLDTTGSSRTHQADPQWTHDFRDQVSAELFPFWRTRANAMAECGRGAIAIACLPCAAPHYVPLRCGSRTCPTCARKAAAAMASRTAARVAVHDIQQEAQPWDGPGKPRRRSWKLVTLTCPALPNIEDRFSRAEQRKQVKRARAAWYPFWRSTAWGRQVRSPGDRTKRARRDTSFAMGGETSPRGVVHLHVLVFGEFIHQRQLQALWGQALGTTTPVIVDVRQIKGGVAGVRDAIREALKYCAKAEKGPRQAAHAASVELAWRGVRRLEIGGALRRVKLPETNEDGGEDLRPEDLHNQHAASCESCGSVGLWRWLGIVPASVVELNGGWGLARDYVPRPEIRPNLLV